MREYRFPYATQAVAMYKRGHSLREVGARYNAGIETVRQAILRTDPSLLRAPCLGMRLEPSERLKKV